MKKNSSLFACALIFVLTLFAFHANASGTPSRYRWTGAVNNVWMNAGNWIHQSGPTIPGGYPGAGGPSATVAPSIRHIAIFNDTSNVNCTIGGSYYPNLGFYIGGIEVNNYSGTITQLSGNRFYISDTYFTSGAYDDQYKAIFNFGAGGKFVGSTYVYSGSEPHQDVVTMSVGVELEIGGSGTFYAPRSLQIQNHITVNAANFDANGGVVRFYPRSGHTYLGVPVGTPANPYKIDVAGVIFYQVVLAPPTWDFQGTDCTVSNDIIIIGGASSPKHLNNGTIHAKDRIIISDADAYGYSCSAFGLNSCGGNATIILDGSIPQQIIKSTAENCGPLPNVTFNNPLGVQISGAVTIGELATFQNGIVTPMSSTTTDRLVFLPSGSTTGASDISYFEGIVKKHIYSGPAYSFVFPIGKNGEYHPIVITAPTGGSGGYGSTATANYDQFSAEYFDTPTPNTSNLATGTYAVHNCQYWTLQRNNKPTSNAKVSLTWDASTCNNSYFTPTTYLRVAQYDGSLWQNLGTSGIASFPPGQKITEAAGAPLTQFNAAAATMFTFCQSIPPFVATISSSTNVTCNGGNDGAATVTTTGGTGTLTYSWNTVPVQTTATATGLAAGTYTVTVNSSTGQIAIATVTITEPAPLSVTLSSLGTICSSSFPVLLNNGSPAGGVYSGGAEITYSTGNYYFDPAISGLGIFPLTYTYTDPSGCVGTASTTDTVIQGPDRPLGWEWADQQTDAGGSAGNDIAVDPITGNVFTTGIFSNTIQFGSTSLTSAGGQDVYVVCHDNSGNVLWAKSYGGTSDDISTGIDIDASGNLFVTGYFYGTSNFAGTTVISNGDRDVFLASINASGTLLWVNTVGGVIDDESAGVYCDQSSNYTYIAGYLDYGSGGQTIAFDAASLTGVYANSFLAKYDNATGLCVWTVKGTHDWQKATALTINSNGHIIVGGYHNYDAYNFLESYDASGTLLNYNSINNNSFNFGIGGMGHDIAGNTYITGIYSYNTSTGSVTFNDVSGTSFANPMAAVGRSLSGVKSEVFVASYDDNLNVTGALNVGANNGNFPVTDIAVADNGDQYITGTFIGTIDTLCFSMGSFGYDDIFIVKRDITGEFHWGQKPDGGYFETNPGITMDDAGNIYETGNMYGGLVEFGAIPLVVSSPFYGTAFVAKLSTAGTSNYRKADETNAIAENKTNGLTVYPNPNNGLFTIETKTAEPKNIIITDVMGKVIFTATQTSDSNVSIDLTTQPAGIYFIQVVTGNSSETQRVIRQ